MDKSNLAATALCTCFNLRKAARIVTQFYGDAIRDSGLNGTQFSLLSVAATMGPAPMGRLANEMAMDRTTLTRNLKPLESLGLIRFESGVDRRQRRVAITAKGEDALARALPMWREAQTKIIDRLGDDRWGELLRLLGAVRTAAH